MRIMHLDDGHNVDNWVCEFSEQDAARFGGSRMIEMDVSEKKMADKGAVSGGCLLKVGSSSYVEQIRNNADVDVDNGNSFFGSRSSGEPASVNTFMLHVSSEEDFDIETLDESIDVRHFRHRRAKRKLAQSTGNLETLMVRVTDKDNKVARFSKSEMYDNVFNDSVCLKSQYAACSYNLINIEPGQTPTVGGQTVNGVIDVKVTKSVSEGASTMQQDAQKQTQDEFGGDAELQNAFDLVMYCQPSGSQFCDSNGNCKNWIAYAYINDYRSFYNDNWCMSVSVHMHEVGHNLGLHHSGVMGGSEYADKTGAMGYSYEKDDGPNMCFNAPKSYQLGWYPGAMVTVDPLSLPGGSQDFKLNGVSDYDEIGDGIVTLRLEYDGTKLNGKDWYIGYNRRDGINSGTQAEPNKVHIYEKESQSATSDGRSVGKSWRIKTLNANENYSWNIGGTTVNLRVNSINGADAYVTLTGGVGPSEPPTKNPTSTPTRNPTKNPTKVPTRNPTVSPTKAPTRNPTVSPTKVPTRNPTVSPTKVPTRNPTVSPTKVVVVVTDPPTKNPTSAPTSNPTASPTAIPTSNPTASPTAIPTSNPTASPTKVPTRNPTVSLTKVPTRNPTVSPTKVVVVVTDPPTKNPTSAPTSNPTVSPTAIPTSNPTVSPTAIPTSNPTASPTAIPTSNPTASPTKEPTKNPTADPTMSPTVPLAPPVCTDDDSYRQNNKRRRSCNWMQRDGDEKMRKRCALGGGEPIIFCPEACRNPECGFSHSPTESPVTIIVSDPCTDDPNYRQGGFQRRSCFWMQKNDSKRERRCALSNGEPMIYCPEACGSTNCAVESPVNACTDDLEYRHRGYEERDCNWMQRDGDAKREKRCAFSGGEPAKYCPVACHHPDCV